MKIYTLDEIRTSTAFDNTARFALVSELQSEGSTAGNSPKGCAVNETPLHSYTRLPYLAFLALGAASGIWEELQQCKSGTQGQLEAKIRSRIANAVIAAGSTSINQVLALFNNDARLAWQFLTQPSLSSLVDDRRAPIDLLWGGESIDLDDLLHAARLFLETAAG